MRGPGEGCDPVMKYLILMAQDEKVWAGLSSAEQQSYLKAHKAFGEALRQRSAELAGEALAGSTNATTMRHHAGATVLTDGPYSEAVEQLGGFYLIDVPDLDEAIALCELLPHAYSVEIRPVIDIDLDVG